MKIEVEKLNDALSFVKAGLTANSYIELAGTISILIKDGNLFFVTEPDDGEVKYQTRVCQVQGEADRCAAVDGFQLIQAVSTCSGTSVDIEIEEDRLAINNGRGSLYLSILVDDSGEIVSNTREEVSGDAISVGNTEVLKLVTSCLSTTMDNISLRNIYCNNGVTLASDTVNIAKGPEVLSTEMLVTSRMRDFLLKYPECKVLVSDDRFTMIQGDKEALFTKSFQDYLEEFPVEALEEEFAKKKLHSFTVDMEQFLNALSFLRVTTNSVNDYAVTLRAAGPSCIELESDHGSKQSLPVTWLTEENGPWEIQFDCVSALARFAFADGVRQVDVYESQIAVVGPVEVSLGLVAEDY